MVPVYLASLAGPEFLDEEKMVSIDRTVFFRHSLSFVLGFSVVFTGLGALAGLTGSFISPNSLTVRYLIGLSMILLGLYMVAATKLPWLNFEKRLNVRTGSHGYSRSFLTGAIFTFAWTPCVSPILGSILGLAMSGATVGRGTALLLVYSIGLSIPFLAIGLALGSVMPLLKKIAHYGHQLYVVSGLILMAIGALIILGKLNLIS